MNNELHELIKRQTVTNVMLGRPNPRQLAEKQAARAMIAKYGRSEATRRFSPAMIVKADG